MTQTTQSERLARMEQRQEDNTQDISEIKIIVKELNAKIDTKFERMDKRFVTRSEAYIAGVILTIIATLITVGLNIQDHLK